MSAPSDSPHPYPAPAPADQAGAGHHPRSQSPRLPAAERRRQLLEVALHAFAKEGFHGTSMNEVATAAGVTKPVLYQHFASKRALYQELVDHLGDELQRAIMAGVARAEGPRQQVEAGFRAYFNWATSQGSAFRVLFADRNRTDRDLAAAVARVESMVANRVASLIEIEGISEAERHVLAYGLVGLAEATSRHWLSLGLEAENADAMAEQVATLAWSGLRGVNP